MGQAELRVKCRTCGKAVVRSAGHEAPHLPFCSERCKLLDLGKWLDGTHRIEEPLEPGGDEVPEAEDAE